MMSSLQTLSPPEGGRTGSKWPHSPASSLSSFFNLGNFETIYVHNKNLNPRKQMNCLYIKCVKIAFAFSFYNRGYTSDLAEEAHT